MKEAEKQPIPQNDSDMGKVTGGFNLLRDEDAPCPKCGQLAHVRVVEIDFETEWQWNCEHCGYHEIEYVERR